MSIIVKEKEDGSKKRRKIAIIAVAACSAMMMSRDVNDVIEKFGCANGCRNVEKKGEYDLLLNQLRLEDQESFRRYLRMNTATFQELM